MPSPRTIALLGCGLWGRRILADLLTLGARVLVIDPAPEARSAAVTAGARLAGSVAEAAAEAAAWVVATPASAHLACLRELAPLRLPILCEKPLCLDARQARALAALELGDCHMLDVWRYHPAVAAIAALAAEGALGEVQGLRSIRINWTSPRTDVDSLLNLAPHELSIYREIFGCLPQPRSAHFEVHAGQVRGAWLAWQGGPWLISEIGNRSPLRRRELRLHGRDAIALWDAQDPHTLTIASGDSDAQLEASERRRLPLSPEPALRRQLAAWLDWLDGGPPPRSDLAHGIEVIERIDAVRRLGAAA